MVDCRRHKCIRMHGMLPRRSDVGAAAVLLLSDNMLKYICYINLSIIITYLAQKLGVWHIVQLAQICRCQRACNRCWLVNWNDWTSLQFCARLFNLNCFIFWWLRDKFLTIYIKRSPLHSESLSFSPSHSPPPPCCRRLCIHLHGLHCDRSDGNRIQSRMDLRRCRFKYSLDK